MRFTGDLLPVAAGPGMRRRITSPAGSAIVQTTDRLRLVHSGPMPYDKIHLMTLGMAFGISRDSRFVQVVGVAADKNEEVYCTQHVE